MQKFRQIINVNKLNYDGIVLKDDDIIALDFTSFKKTSFLYGFDKELFEKLFNALSAKYKVLLTCKDVSISDLKDYLDSYKAHGFILHGTYTRDFLHTFNDNFKNLTSIVFVDDRTLVLDAFLKIYSDLVDYFIVDNFDTSRSLLDINKYLDKVFLVDVNGSYETFVTDNNFKGLVR